MNNIRDAKTMIIHTQSSDLIIIQGATAYLIISFNIITQFIFFRFLFSHVYFSIIIIFTLNDIFIKIIHHNNSYHVYFSIIYEL